MTYFPTNVMKLILSYNDTSAQRAEKKRQLAPITQAEELRTRIVALCRRYDYGERGDYGEYDAQLKALQKEGKKCVTYSKLHRFALGRYNVIMAFNRGYWKSRTKGVRLTDYFCGKRGFIQYPIPLEQEHILVGESKMTELKQYCRDNQLKGFSKHTSKQKLSGFIMKQNF